MQEFYVVKLDGDIGTEAQLFAVFTETIYLGESGIPGWDQFYDLLFLRLMHSDIHVRVEITDDFLLWPKVADGLTRIQESLAEECPDKLLFIRPKQ